ncbi:unnamed protein product [Thlaspi arvense]|uniref:GCK domain-containing protein n=1 Tax=Thlaspi arvense TaxID=13288 RepID=A0AAU9REL5_THLAR|nr:unnamed protein product [Thlaspi arvense]
MGIRSSKPRYDFFLLEHLAELEELNLEEETEEERVQIEAGAYSTFNLILKKLHPLFPAETGKVVVDTETKRDEAEDEEVLERFCNFMKAGACKEPVKHLEDCMEKVDSVTTHRITRCKEHLPILKKCMDAHIDYYEPILAIFKAAEDYIINEISAKLAKDREEEFASRPKDILTVWKYKLLRKLGKHSE